MCVYTQYKLDFRSLTTIKHIRSNMRFRNSLQSGNALPHVHRQTVRQNVRIVANTQFDALRRQTENAPGVRANHQLREAVLANTSALYTADALLEILYIYQNIIEAFQWKRNNVLKYTSL